MADQLPLFPIETPREDIEEIKKRFSPKERRIIEKSIDQIIGVFQKPLVVADPSWADQIPTAKEM